MNLGSKTKKKNSNSAPEAVVERGHAVNKNSFSFLMRVHSKSQLTPNYFFLPTLNNHQHKTTTLSSETFLITIFKDGRETVVCRSSRQKKQKKLKKQKKPEIIIRN